jgi:hypothetical protein
MNLADNQLDGISWIYQRIQDYCEHRANGIGGYYGQTSYKRDFFNIFSDAFLGGFCGYQARQRYSKRCSRLKGAKPAFIDYVVTGEGIHQRLNRDWLLGGNQTRDNEEMVSTLCEWWDAWDYSWANYPGDMWSPRSHLNRIKQSLETWMKESGHKPK